MLMNQEFDTQDVNGRTQLRILATTDLHMWMLGYDYYLDRPDAGHSLARLAPLIERRRGEALNSCLFGNGDLLQGTPMADVLVADWANGLNSAHPVMKTLSRLGYDAATVGNHDFNFGLPYLEAAIESAGFPVVCANALRKRGATPAEDVPYFPPFALIDKELTMADGTTAPIRIGVIGFLPPQIIDWDRAHLKGRLDTRGIVETARFHVPRLRAAGADIVVALCHSGVGKLLTDDRNENAGLALSTVQGIDALVLGHVHRTFPAETYADYDGVDLNLGTLCGTPTVMPGFWGSHLGVIDLGLDCTEGRWTVINHTSTADPVIDAAPPLPSPPGEPEKRRPKTQSAASHVSQLMSNAHQRTLDLIRRPVGKTAARLHSYFGELGPSPVENLIRDAKLSKCNALIRQGRLPDLPVLCLTSPFKSGGFSGPDYYTDIPAGDLALRHVADMYLYPNALSIIRRTGKQVHEILQNTAALFATLSPGDRDTPLLPFHQPHYTLDWMHGLTYDFDLSKPPGPDRVRNVQLGGFPLDPNQSVLVVTNSYRLAISQPPVDPNDIRFDDPLPMRDILIEHLEAINEHIPVHHSPMQFVPFDRPTSCVLTIGTGARDLIDQDPRMHLIDQNSDGFLRVRFDLSSRGAKKSA